MKKIAGESQGSWDANFIIPQEFVNVTDPFKWGVHGSYEAIAPVGVGPTYKGERYRAQAGGSGGDPNAGKGPM